MKRTPIVLGGTIAGLVGVLLFHTTPGKTSFTTLPAVSGPSPAPVPAPASSAGTSAGTSAPSGASAPSASSAAPSASSATSAAAGSQASSTRSATGSQVNYTWGVLSVKVTVAGKKITSVGIASLDDGGNPRSEMIDQQSIPILEQEVMQAQSANIQSVSGASYTSAGFVQSLQSALQSLGLS